MENKDEKFNTVWERQLSFTEKFWNTKGGMPDFRDQKVITDVSKDYAIHLITEVTEVVGELSWRMHRADRGQIDRSNVLEELVDCFKFVLGFAQVWGFSKEEFFNEFLRKSAVVEQRFEQEQTLPVLRNHPCVLVDIDGVIADYPNFFYEWYRKNIVDMSSIHEAKKEYEKLPLESRESIKCAYRQSGAKASMTVLPDALNLLLAIKEKGLKIILITNRPYAEYYRIYPDTLEFLKLRGLPYDAIIWTRDKGLEAVKLFKNVAWAVDDDLKNVVRLREAGITTIHLNPHDPERNTSALYDFMVNTPKLSMENVGYAWNEAAQKAASQRRESERLGRAR